MSQRSNNKIKKESVHLKALPFSSERNLNCKNKLFLSFCHVFLLQSNELHSILKQFY